MAKHPGFSKVQAQIVKNVTPRAGETKKQAAGAILASSTRNASPKAKATNPNLRHVAMPKKKQVLRLTSSMEEQGTPNAKTEVRFLGSPPSIKKYEYLTSIRKDGLQKASHREALNFGVLILVGVMRRLIRNRSGVRELWILRPVMTQNIDERDGGRLILRSAQEHQQIMK